MVMARIVTGIATRHPDLIVENAVCPKALGGDGQLAQLGLPDRRSKAAARESNRGAAVEFADRGGARLVVGLPGARVIALPAIELGGVVDELPVGVKHGAQTKPAGIGQCFTQHRLTAHRRIGMIVRIVAVVPAVCPTEETDGAEAVIKGQLPNFVEVVVIPIDRPVLLLEDGEKPAGLLLRPCGY